MLIFRKMSPLHRITCSDSIEFDLQLDACCSTLVKKIRDCYGWNGDVNLEPSIGAWIGEIPVYLKHGDKAVSNGSDVFTSDVFVKTEKELECPVPEIASYQVLVSFLVSFLQLK